METRAELTVRNTFPPRNTCFSAENYVAGVICACLTEQQMAITSTFVLFKAFLTTVVTSVGIQVNVECWVRSWAGQHKRSSR
jgi:hypothetical protein